MKILTYGKELFKKALSIFSQKQATQPVVNKTKGKKKVKKNNKKKKSNRKTI